MGESQRQQNRLRADSPPTLSKLPQKEMQARVHARMLDARRVSGDAVGSTGKSCHETRCQLRMTRKDVSDEGSVKDGDTERVKDGANTAGRRTGGLGEFLRTAEDVPVADELGSTMCPDARAAEHQPAENEEAKPALPDSGLRASPPAGEGQLVGAALLRCLRAPNAGDRLTKFWIDGQDPAITVDSRTSGLLLAVEAAAEKCSRQMPRRRWSSVFTQRGARARLHASKAVGLYDWSRRVTMVFGGALCASGTFRADRPISKSASQIAILGISLLR